VIEATPAGTLLLTSPDAEAAWPQQAASAIAAAGGQVLALGGAADSLALEPGTEPRALVIAVWPDLAGLLAAWPSLAPQLGRGAGRWLALAVAAAPLAGDGVFPSRANAAPVVSAGPRAYMLVEGVVTKPEPMARYRDMIFPMISARGGYYRVYAWRDAVTILAGDWPHQAVIVSCWPDPAAAHDFWFSERYQTQAIPTRAGAGQFSVLLLTGLPDAAAPS
jgi:uncharacterized protein (DUF1330 family)